MDELKNDLENELVKAKAKGADAYGAMRCLKRRMESQREEILVCLNKLGNLLEDYQSTCNSFHYAQGQAIKACHDERVIREMQKLSEEL